LSDPYTEQEQVEKLKQWWKTYGNALVLGIALGLAILFGNKYWTDYKQQRAASASALYDQLLEDYRKKAFDDARKTAGKIINEYAATPYAGLAAMMLARADFDAKQNEEVQRQLRWVVDNASDTGARHVARLRLARLLAADGKTDAALALITIKDIAGFESSYEELRGDLLVAKGDKQGAREAYARAIKHLDARSPYLPVLNMKLDDLGPETDT
jgi:predicted negative regulator of RcsB-dependent stress response